MRTRIVASAVFAILVTTLSACSNSGAANSSQDLGVTRVEMDGARVASYSLSSPAEFVESGFVSAAVTGTVTNIETAVYDDADVFTLVSIRPDGSTGDAGTIVTRESGGVARLADVRSDFEGRVSDEVLDRNANQLIEYVDMDDPIHSKVGERVAVLLSGEPADLGGYFTAASLIEQADGSYRWIQGTPPNPAWPDQLSAAQVQALTEAANRR